ncbi:MAG TPA: DUF1508 domain-containing protein [Solirubrobacteraceae bacterium]|jgi:uncharacterized protein YegP (UPF0339 family)|nr:DUF1508 domain-containing protein [Solirubrobacteraceae bacterium]
MRYDVYEDAGGNYRWRLKSSNGQIVASSGQSFSSHSNATAACRNFKTKCSQWAFEIYADAGGHYRWRAKSRNGEIVASSGESFASRANAERAAENVKDNGGAAAGP